MSEGAQAIIDRLSRCREAGLEYPVITIPHESIDELTTQIEAIA